MKCSSTLIHKVIFIIVEIIINDKTQHLKFILVYINNLCFIYISNVLL